MTASPAALAIAERRDGIRRALVLSGGGARGAYEVGVLQFVFGKLCQRLGFVPRIDVYCGTSVGAVHCCFLAAHAHEPEAGVARLAEIWREMSFSSVYEFQLGDAFNFSRTLLSSLAGFKSEAGEHPDRLHGLLNTTPLERLVVRQIPWRRLRRNLRSQELSALCVSATEIGTGRTVAFIDSRERQTPRWTNDVMHIARVARIGPDHALASAAIPFLFPAVRIRDTYFCDGSLRQHTPLTPALRLGANRLLIVGLRRGQAAAVADPVAEERLQRFRSAGFLFGKVLNALLIDRLEYDVTHMRVLNQLLRAGLEVCGPDHIDHINPHVARERGIGFQLVEDCFVRPSEDIGAIAAKHVTRLRQKRSGSWIGRLTFRALTRGAPEDEADLMSYLLFDGEYAAELSALGRSDAERAEEQLAALFTD